MEQGTRVLVFVPTARDAANSKAVLGKAGLPCILCSTIQELCTEMEAGAGAVLLTEESLSLDKASRLQEILRTQPAWSDLPIVVLARGGTESPVASRAMQKLGNVILLGRPIRVSTLLTALHMALRMRGRQYQSREHLAELQAANQRKNEFLAMLAHELRNPLAPIQNTIELFRLLQPADANLQRAQQVMDRQVQHLTRLVDDLLDVSRITQGKVELKIERLELATIIARAVETSRPALDSRRQRLQVALPQEPVFLDGDLTRLAQTVSNLLNNAAKFTQEKGHIWLTAAREAEKVAIRVRDDGIGIPREMLPKIFDLFTQADNSLDRSQGGLGIGLTLVRTIAEMHGGSVHVQSAGPGGGSEFTVRLPALTENIRHEGADSEQEKPVSVTPRRVLVVDDNADSAESLAMVLAMLGHEVGTAYDGVSALKLAESFRPEVVVLDIGLPGMSGYEVARRLRRQPELGRPLLIALTGYGQAEDRQRARDAGFDHHLVKPVRSKMLQEVLAGVAGGGGA